MPDIDVNPASLARADSSMNEGGNGSASKSLALNPPVLKGGKPVQSAPRVDIEPIYTSLKAAIGDSWATYKEAVTKYILGHLSQQELTRLLVPFLLSPNPQTKPSTGDTQPLGVSELVHLHNRLLSALHSNTFRDPPDTPVAPWVSANDKPAPMTKQASGDAHDQRLRNEVMNLPPRTRHRLKNITDDSAAPITSNLQQLAAAKRPTLSTTTPLSPSSSSLPLPSQFQSQTQPSSQSATSLNQDSEIRKRYTQPLASELLDLPASSTIADRLLPICYEEGLTSGAGNPGKASDLLAIALEMYMKSELAFALSRTQTNAPISRPQVAPGEETTGRGIDAEVDASNLGVVADMGVATGRFKTQLAIEEAAALRGEIKRTEMGLLPVEVAEQRNRASGRGMPGDLRLIWELGDAGFGRNLPWLGERLVLGEPHLTVEKDGSGGWSGDWEDDKDRDSGFWERDGDGDVKMDGGDEEAWIGAGRADREMLGSLLDECLASG